ncbi:uncharacterized protein LOC116188512 [Punica granatum]|uniref:Uncharacterized protein n=2 Tax=Punica granatum TaxID=22663 RepID=A0A218XF92_PUNGR|nr:uncharacterized protein LOC116188512 [Punica granatum]OWM83012.1 hypothetical protein CDL15_Pgr005412 [Punica granatum]PKH53948.1 hypothetical protein CRG98_050326 [Punica granatum]
MCSEVCPPRTSFSRDLEEESAHQAQPMMLDSGSDFEFSFDGGVRFESCQSSADELFADGMILPVFHRADHNALPVVAPRRASGSLPPLPVPDNPKKEVAVPKEESSGSSPDSEGAKPASRYFWGFKRIASLSNSDKKGLICPLPLLSRSNSTGSVPHPKRSLQKQPSVKMAKSSSFSASSSSSMSGYGHHQGMQKPPLSRKTSRGSSNNGAYRANPVLKVPSPYIIGTANLFGLGSFFCNGKDKKKIRR